MKSKIDEDLPVELAEVLIVATALHHTLTLLNRNGRDFQRIPQPGSRHLT